MTIKVFGVSRTAIHKVLKEMLAEDRVRKSGKVPKVYYRSVRITSTAQ